MHYITEIKDIGKKCRIIIDDDIVVQLYKGEVRKLGIKADSQFSNESYNEMYNILNKRARERSLFLLKDMDVLVPPIELQEQFADFAQATDKSKVAIQAALDKTQLLFDSLMQKYFG